MVPVLSGFSPNISTNFYSLHAGYMLHPYHCPWSDDTNNLSWRLQITELLITHVSPASFYFLSLRFKYFPSTPGQRWLPPSVIWWRLIWQTGINGAERRILRPSLEWRGGLSVLKIGCDVWQENCMWSCDSRIQNGITSWRSWSS